MATRKFEFTKLALDNLEPAAPGRNYEAADTLVPGLRVRVSDGKVAAGRYRGKAAIITFVLVARYPPSMNPTRRSLGRYSRDSDQLSLHAAREKAREWKSKIAAGIDPIAEADLAKVRAEDALLQEQARKLEEEAAAFNRKMLKDYLDQYAEEKLAFLNQGAAMRLALDGKEGLLKDLLDRDPTTLVRSDIAKPLKAKAKTAPISANRQLAYAKAFFNWCVSEELLASSPAATLKKPSKEVGRDRSHTIEELREIWAASGELGYPFRQLFRLLIVLPMRREEVAGIPKRELSLGVEHSPISIWTLPAARTKLKNALRIPISTLARMIILEALAHPERPEDSAFVFSTTGDTSVSGFSKAKRRLDVLIMEARQKVAAECGADAETMPHWTLHDLRTTFNTIACDVLEIDANVADRILNHVATATTSKVMRVYNRSELFEPRRRALEDWAKLVEREVIVGEKVSPTPILVEPSWDSVVEAA